MESEFESEEKEESPGSSRVSQVKADMLPQIVPSTERFPASSVRARVG